MANDVDYGDTVNDQPGRSSRVSILGIHRGGAGTYVQTGDTSALEARARRAAAKAGLVARKNWWHSDRNGFMLIDPQHSVVVAGHQFDLTAQDVLAYCEGENADEVQ